TDYYKESMNDNCDTKILFLACREEILLQHLHIFRHVLQDHSYRDLFVGKHSPTSFEHLFISIQTWNSKQIKEKTTSDYYDFIIVDEVHHAPADTFDKLLTFYNPKVLLGLTATPERMDNKDVLHTLIIISLARLDLLRQ